MNRRNGFQELYTVHETTDLITIGLRVEGNRQNSYAFEDRPVEEGAFGNFLLQIL